MTEANTEVEIESGRLRGLRCDGLDVFRNIPFAAAPTSDNRFKPPLPVQPWSGVRDATKAGPVCPQGPSRLSFAMGDFAAAQDEDCLNLTVWTPKADNGRRPVLVWLHGGAYMSGAGAIDWYCGAPLAREGGLVVVGVNYRLGALGFICHPDVSAGNVGLLDQEAALAWVRANIAAFGGDPDNVTLWGQSAGAQSAIFLLMREQARRLFKRVILQSAPFGNLPRAPETGAAVVERMARELDLSAPGKLRAVSIERLLAAYGAAGQALAKEAQRGGLPSPPFWPVGDGAIVPTRETYQTALQAAAPLVDVLIGTTREEMAVFFASNPALQDLQKAPIPDADIARLQARRPAATAADVYADYCGEQVFLNGSLAWAEQAATAGRRVYLYQFDWPSPNRKLQACHCVDLPFVFGTREAFAAAPMLANADNRQVDALSASMRAAWIAFTRGGDPNHSGLPPWPQFDTKTRATMHFDNVCGASGAL